MRVHSGILAVGVLATALVVTGPGWAATGAMAPGGALTLAEAPAADAPASADQVPAIRPMTDGEKQAAGCVISGVGTMAATYAIGPSEMIMLIVGGLIVPSNSEALFISLMATMASMGCGAGAAITPAVLWAWKQTDQIGQQAAVIGAGLKGAVATLTGRGAEFAEAPGAAR